MENDSLLNDFGEFNVFTIDIYIYKYKLGAIISLFGLFGEWEDIPGIAQDLPWLCS